MGVVYLFNDSMHESRAHFTQSTFLYSFPSGLDVLSKHHDFSAIPHYLDQFVGIECQAPGFDDRSLRYSPGNVPSVLEK
jgi:hypothetical protein